MTRLSFAVTQIAEESSFFLSARKGANFPKKSMYPDIICFSHYVCRITEKCLLSGDAFKKFTLSLPEVLKILNCSVKKFSPSQGPKVSPS